MLRWYPGDPWTGEAYGRARPHCNLVQPASARTGQKPVWPLGQGHSGPGQGFPQDACRRGGRLGSRHIQPPEDERNRAGVGLCGQWCMGLSCRLGGALPSGVQCQGLPRLVTPWATHTPALCPDSLSPFKVPFYKWFSAYSKCCSQRSHRGIAGPHKAPCSEFLINCGKLPSHLNKKYIVNLVCLILQ